MKFSLRLLAFALGAGLAFTAPTAAQAQVRIGVQIGAPAWGPPVPQGTQYYYIPEIDGYYDIYNQVYIVFNGVQWVALPYLDGYDPYYFHPYPVNYVGPQPWLYINTYRRYYPQYVMGWRRGGWGNAGPYYNHDYGAGRVYGYGNPRGYHEPRPGGYYDNRPDYHDNRGNYPNRPGNGYPNQGTPQHWDRQNGNYQPQQSPQGNFPGGGGNQGQGGGYQGGQPGGGQPQQQPGNFPGGGRRGGR